MFLSKFSFFELTGLICFDPVFKIYDIDKKLFYHQKNSGLNKFNLPAGIYYTANKIKISDPIKFNIQIPEPEKQPEPGIKIKIFLTENKNKASINPANGKIYFDREIFKGDRTKRNFIFFHEIGHLFYFSEVFCDLFAVACLLKIGFNPSQIFKASKNSLSKKNIHRILHTYKQVIK